MRPLPFLLAATLLLALPVAACGSDEPQSAAPPGAGPTVGGDPQPEVADVVRVGLTKKQKNKIVNACQDAQEIITGGDCRESLPPADQPTPGGPDPCDLTDYCMIVDAAGEAVLVVEGDPPADTTAEDAGSGSVQLRLEADDAVIAELVDSGPASPSESPSPTEQQTSDPPAEETPTPGAS